MKFKILIITLNIVIFISFVSFFILPLLAFSGAAKFFLSKNWFFPPIFIAILAFINILYFRNKSIIENLEAEDWTGLCHTLEVEVFDKNRASFRNVNLLSDVQLLLSDFSGLQRLETYVRSKKPEYLSRLAPNFAGGKFLSGNYSELHSFVSNLIRSGKKDEWLLFYLPFSLQMQKSYSEASKEFENCLNKFNEPILNLMTGYFYYEVLKIYCKLSEKERIKSVKAFKDNIKAQYSLETWNNYTAQKRQEMHILIFKKIIADASSWLFNT
ncbi:MAG: hypothetical protein P1P64_04465 [Treponemataceae bacterium]